jgi:hypothetical protein
MLTLVGGANTIRVSKGTVDGFTTKPRPYSTFGGKGNEQQEEQDSAVARPHHR